MIVNEVGKGGEQVRHFMVKNYWPLLRTERVRSTFLLCCALAYSWVGSAVIFGQSPHLTLEPLAVEEYSHAGSTATWSIRLEPRLLLGNPARLHIDLPDGLNVEVVRETWLQDGEARSWTGRTVGAPRQHSLVTLSVVDGRVAGIIDTETARYRVMPTAIGHAVERSVESHSDCSGALVPPRELVPLLEASSGSSSDGLVAVEQPSGQPVIKILVLFTPSAAGVVGGAIQSSASSAVSYLNRVIDNTGVQGSARLVGAEVIDTLSGAPGLDEFLPRLRTDAVVAQRRAALGADIVQLFVGFSEAGGGCGLGYLLTRGDTSRGMAPWAFGATSIRCEPEATFAHEVGHNIGLNHNPSDASTPRPFHAWSYGHRDSNVKTTMSYGGQREIPYYSNPDVTTGGFATGISGERDNARTLATTMSLASGYVGGSQPVPVTPPSGLTANLETASTAVLNWIDETSDETGFRVEQRTNGASWRFATALASNVESTVIENLEPAREYSFRVRTLQGSRTSSPSNVARVNTPFSASAPATLTAAPASEAAVELTWSAATNPAPQTAHLVIEARSAGYGYQTVADLPSFSDALDGVWMVEGLEADTPYTFRTRVVEEAGATPSPVGGEASATTRGYQGACRDDDRSLCLLDGRFEVRVSWRNQNLADDFGVGTAVPIVGSEESGMFWFFGAQNIELVVKMLDARSFTQSFWEFYGALSDVEYWISTRDTTDGTLRTYHNQPASQCGLADINAFPVLPGAGGVGSLEAEESLSRRWMMPLPDAFEDLARASRAVEVEGDGIGSCVADEDTLCFVDGRFAVEVEYAVTVPEPRTGIAQTLPTLSTLDTGFFWFFQDSNVELAVKILDAQVINQRYWLFWGALSDVEYHVKVTDTTNGAELLIDNAAGSFCGGSDLGTLGAPVPP